MRSPSPVLVLGAGGATGRALVGALLDAGHQVTAAARTPAALPEFTSAHGSGDAAARLTIARVDVRDTAEVAEVAAGHRTVVSAVGPPGRRPGGLYAESARSLVTAVPGAGVDRVLVMTSAGVTDDPEHAHWYRAVAHTLLRELYDDMRRLEAVLRDSDLAWTFVRPTRITDDPPTGSYRVGDARTPARGRRISRVDLARFVAGELDDRRWIRAAPTLAR